MTRAIGWKSNEHIFHSHLASGKSYRNRNAIWNSRYAYGYSAVNGREKIQANIISQFAVDVLDRPRLRSHKRLGIPQAAGAGCDLVSSSVVLRNGSALSCGQYRNRRRLFPQKTATINCPLGQIIAPQFTPSSPALFGPTKLLNAGLLPPAKTRASARSGCVGASPATVNSRSFACLIDRGAV